MFAGCGWCLLAGVLQTSVEETARSLARVFQRVGAMGI